MNFVNTTLENPKQKIRGCFNGPDPKYPRFVGKCELRVLRLLPKNSTARRMQIRPSSYIVRTYSPEGFRESGIYVEKNRKWPRVWAHVLACAKNNPHRLVPGDFILFERHSEETLAFDSPQEPKYLGEKLPVAILHYKAVYAVIRGVDIPMRT